MKILAVLIVSIGCVSCAFTGNSRSPATLPNAQDAFSEYDVCGAEWGALASEWLGGPVSDAGSLEAIHQIVLDDQRTTISVAFRNAWSVDEPWRGEDAFPTRTQDVFIESLSDQLSEYCMSYEWMAIAISNRNEDQWPMSAVFEDDYYQPIPGDVVRAQRFIRAILAYPSKKKFGAPNN